MGTTFYLVLLGVLVYVIYAVVRDFRPGQVRVCKSCGYHGPVRSTLRGSLAIEAVLWLCLIVPGVIYSLWRGTTRHHVCPKCASSDVVPADSPVGKKILGQLRE